MENWIIVLAAFVGVIVFVSIAFAIFNWARRGASSPLVWAAWAALIIGTFITILFAIKSSLDSGPAEAIAIFAGIALLSFSALLPIVHKRIRRSELNKIISKDL